MTRLPRPARALLRRATATAVALAAVGSSLIALTPDADAASTGCPKPRTSLVRTAPGSGKTVALTFDDGPGNVTRQVLSILRANNVRATFFNTGAYDARYAEQTRQIADEGHLVANHTWHHQYPSAANGRWSRSYLNREFDRTNAQQRKLTGRTTCFFRPPGGFQTSGMVAEAAKNHMTTVMWSVDTNDWQQSSRTTKASTNAIIGAARQGYNQKHPVVLMHVGKASHEPAWKVTANRSNDVAALPAIIKGYRDRGYRFVDMAGRSGLPARLTKTTLDGTDQKVAAGTRVTLTATVRDTLGPVKGRQVTWYSRPFGTSTWTRSGHATTDGSGQARFVVRPTTSTDYTVRFAVRPGYRGSEAPHHRRITVPIPPKPPVPTPTPPVPTSTPPVPTPTPTVPTPTGPTPPVSTTTSTPPAGG